jgi:hypothetical protein
MIPIHTIRFVKLNDLLNETDLHENSREFVFERLDSWVTWGDAAHTLVTMDDFLPAMGDLDDSELSEEDRTALKSWLKGLGGNYDPSLCVDMES